MALGCGGFVMVVVLGVVGFVGFIYKSASGPRDVVKGHLEQIRAGKVDGAYEMLSAPYRGQVSREAFTAFVARHPGLQQHADSTFMSFSSDGSRATMGGYVTSGKGDRETATFLLAREDGRWTITNIEVGADHPESLRAQGPGGLHLEPIEAQKSASGETIEVRLVTTVGGFEVRPEGNQYGIDLAVDVETLGPDSLRIEALSREDVQRVRRSTSMERGAMAPLTVPLILDRSLPEGSYTVRLRVRDRVGGGAVSQETQFTLP